MDKMQLLVQKYGVQAVKAAAYRTTGDSKLRMKAEKKMDDIMLAILKLGGYVK